MYCFILAERQCKSVNALLQEMTSAEISEWMAFDRLKDEGYREKIKADMMTADQRTEAIKKLLGFKNASSDR